MAQYAKNEFGTRHEREGCVNVHVEAESHKSRMRKTTFSKHKKTFSSSQKKIQLFS